MYSPGHLVSYMCLVHPCCSNTQVSPLRYFTLRSPSDDKRYCKRRSVLRAVLGKLNNGDLIHVQFPKR